MAKAEEKKNEPHTNIIDLEWCLYVRMFGGQSLKNSSTNWVDFAHGDGKYMRIKHWHILVLIFFYAMMFLKAIINVG